MKTECVCGICGHIFTGNSKFRTERKTWQHIKDEHPAKHKKFLAKREALNFQIDALRAMIPSLYSTTYQGMTSKGSWTI